MVDDRKMINFRVTEEEYKEFERIAVILNRREKFEVIASAA